MRKLLQRLKELRLSYDRMIAYLSIILVVLLILNFIIPNQKFLLFAVFTAGGMINVMNGLKIVRDKKKRNIGMSYIFFGILIILIGFLTTRFFMV